MLGKQIHLNKQEFVVCGRLWKSTEFICNFCATRVYIS